MGNTLYDFKGTIDDVRIYGRTLSTQEVQYLYNTSASSGAAALVRSNHDDIGTGFTSKATATPISPTITLLSFEADVGADGRVTLTWETAREMDINGFNLYRSRLRNGTYTQVNTIPINAKGTAALAASYDFGDTPQRRGTYYYKLEDVNYNGMTTMYGPVRVRAGR
jgi:hypothetical protein